MIYTLFFISKEWNCNVNLDISAIRVQSERVNTDVKSGAIYVMYNISQAIHSIKYGI